MASRLIVPTTKQLIKTFATSAPAAGAAASALPKYTLPTLPYSYSALEPAISGQIMETHHTKHHQAYVNNLNNTIQQYADAEKSGDLQKMIALQPALRFNGGGHVNHSIFWTNLAPPKEGGGGKPTGELLTAIEASFGSFDKFKDTMSAQSIGVQGSGWGWLGYSKERQRVEILTKPNQDPLTELVPLLGFDVWEHAYYYLYGPARAEYIKKIWDIINWQNVSERYAAAKKQ